MVPFEFIVPGHPLFEQMAPLRAAIAAEPALDADSATRSLLRVDFSAAQPQLKWVYVSRQSMVRNAYRFSATTIVLRSKRNRVERYEFPRDSKLDRLGALLGKWPADWKVLRYVPRRRLTIKTEQRVAKFVRRTEIQDVIDRLRSVEGLVNKASGFSIPRVLDCHADNGILFQEFIQGEPLTALVNSGNIKEALGAAGQICRRIHRHPAGKLPAMAIEDVMAATRKDEALLSFLRPDLKEWLNAATKELFARLTSTAASVTFCHGDFRAPHLLCDGNGDWRVIDFDGAVCADENWEQALFVTSLKREFTMFTDRNLHDESVDAFLAGYEREGGKVNREKFRWFRLAAEIHFLARTFQRDLYTPALFAQTVCAIGKLSGIGPP